MTHRSQSTQPRMTPSSVSTAHPTPGVTCSHTALPHYLSSDPAAPVHPREVVATADGVCKFPGQQLSWWQAQDSCEQRFGHLALAPPAGVLAPRLPNPIWVRQKEAPLRRPPQRRECGLRAGEEEVGGQKLWRPPELEPIVAVLLGRAQKTSPSHLQVPLSWTKTEG